MVTGIKFLNSNPAQSFLFQQHILTNSRFAPRSLNPGVKQP